MLIQRMVPKDAPEGIYVRVKNGSSGALANGDVVIWDTTAGDGITVNTTATAGSKYVAGVIIDSIAAGDYGRMQIYGYHPAVKVDGGTTDVAQGDLLGTGGMAKYAFTTTTTGTVLGVALAGVTTVSTGKVFIKCM